MDRLPIPRVIRDAFNFSSPAGAPAANPRWTKNERPEWMNNENSLYASASGDADSFSDASGSGMLRGRSRAGTSFHIGSPFGKVRRQSMDLGRRASVSLTKMAHGKPVNIPETLMAYEIQTHVNEKQHVEHQMEKLALKKANLPFSRLCFLGLLSGVWMVLAASGAITAASSFSSEVVEMFPVLPRLMLGLYAPVAMHFIVIFGGEFYSGNCMYMCVGVWTKHVTAQQAINNLSWVFIWNAIGCICSSYTCVYLTEIFAAPDQRMFVIRAAEGKARLSFMTSFLRGIPANILICTSIQMGISARDMAGKLLALHIPLTAYTVAGFEHSITNLVVVPLGIMYGADVNLASWMWNNLFPAAAGNFIGGLIVAGFITMLYSWDKNASTPQGNLNMPSPSKRRNSLMDLMKHAQNRFHKINGNLEYSMASAEKQADIVKSLAALKVAQDELAAAQQRLAEQQNVRGS